MKKILLAILIIVSGVAYGQSIPGYTYINGRYNYFSLSTAPNGTFHVPSGATAILGNGAWGRSGAMFYDSTGADSGLYVYHAPYWVKVGAKEGLQQVITNDPQLTSGAYNNIDVNNGTLVIGESQVSCCTGMGVVVSPQNDLIAITNHAGGQQLIINTSTGGPTSGQVVLQNGSGSSAKGMKIWASDSILIGTLSGNYTKTRIKLSPDSLLIKNLASTGASAQSNIVIIDSITGQLRQIPKSAVGSTGFIYRDSVSAINIKSLGAVGDGTTDNATVLQAAAALAYATGLAVFIPAGTFYTSDSTMFQKTQIYGNGINSILKVTSSTVTPIVLQDSCEVSGIKFIGTGKGAVPGGTITTQNGIRINGGYNNIHDCYFTGITGSGIVVYETSGGVTVYNNRGNNNRFLNCTVAIFSLLNDEYSIYSGNDVMSCTVGLWDRSGGNTRWLNNTVEYCTDGFRMTAGGNGDHNNVVGCTFNHNTNNLNIQSTTLGVTFTGCSMLSGDILIGSVATANNVIIAESNLYQGNIAGTTTTNTVIRDCNDLGLVTHSGSGITYVNNHNTTDLQYATTGGNILGATMTIGTNDPNTLAFETNNNTKMQIASTGEVGIGVAPATNFRLFLTGYGNTSATYTQLNRNANGDNTFSVDDAANAQLGLNANGASVISLYGLVKPLNTKLGAGTDSVVVKLAGNSALGTIAASAIPLLVGTQPMTSGTDTRVLFQDGTTLGEDAGMVYDKTNDILTLAGVILAPTARGSTASGGTLTLNSTSNATKGKILFGTSAYDEVNNRLGIGTASPGNSIETAGTVQAGAFSTTAVGINSNFFTSTSVGTSRTTSAPFLFPGGAGTSARVWVNGTTATTQTAGDDYAQVAIGAGVITEAGSSTAPRTGSLFVGQVAVTNGAGASDTLYGGYFAGPATGVTAGTGSWGVIVNKGGVLSKYGDITIGLAYGLKVTEGTDGRAGQTTLVSGTKAITINGLTTSSRAIVTLVTPSGVTLTTTYQAVCTANTLTIQANVAAGTINTADGSTLNYFVIN